MASLIGMTKRILYLAYDKWRGVDFQMDVSAEIDHSNLDGHSKYTASGFGRLMSIVSFLKSRVMDQDAIIDVGCGKGKCLEYFSALPFQCVDGLEYSSELAAIAQRNMEKLKLECHVFCADATKFTDYDKYNYFYMYNPFYGGVFLSFLGRLKESVSRNPRKITLIYVIPICHEALLEAGFVLETKLSEQIYVYTFCP